MGLLSYAHSRLVPLRVWKAAAEVVIGPQPCVITQWASRSSRVTQAERSSTGRTVALFAMLSEGLGIHEVLNNC